jgi:hypothetical protein
MFRTAEVVPYKEGLSRLSYDDTGIKCSIEGCDQNAILLLTVPGEHIGRPGRTFRVIRCLNCHFWDTTYVYFNENGEATKVVVDGAGDCQGLYRESLSYVASLIWSDTEYEEMLELNSCYTQDSTGPVQLDLCGCTYSCAKHVISTHKYQNELDAPL